MNGETTDQPPTPIYRVEIEGHLDCSWAEWFDGMMIDQQPNGISVLCGNVTDQSALFGLLKKMHNMGLTIISVQRVGFK
ncbi:MAG: hypothetical protein DWQ04_33185 [Chloroflexi bacterium]|nr:MAG: hypothetical protein DWQ04_33185 [Chloroflexota bacterium]